MVKQLVIGFVVFIFTDLITTYLASPDLALEKNFFVQVLGLGWPGTILQSVIQALFLIAAVISSVRYMCIKRPRWGNLVLAYLGIGAFMFHFAGSVLATINNLLLYFSLESNHGMHLHKFAKIYAEYTNNRYFLTWFGLSKLILAIWPSILLIKSTKRFTDRCYARSSLS